MSMKILCTLVNYLSTDFCLTRNRSTCPQKDRKFLVTINFYMFHIVTEKITCFFK